ncbi:uncharacterized protein LOC134854785 [Symsagittifera roscoffensis]|uniref:uncharacterized protein LOC134854785 n=1 Tax=Symsagittifera roscoffensis TaxID=84072 RepID=UPI00307BEB0C
MEECITKLKAWKANMEEKSVRVNMKKTKILVSGLGLDQLQDSDSKLVSPRCRGEARPIDGRPETQLEVDGTLLDVEASLCYLGDIMCAGGGCERAITVRCCAAWGKFRRLIPILTNRLLSPNIRGKMFTACVRSTTLHGSETWAPNTSDLQRPR